MATVALEQQELEDILDYISSIGQANPSQMAGSTSSARNRRKRSKTQPKSAEGIGGLSRKQARKEENIGLV